MKKFLMLMLIAAFTGTAFAAPKVTPLGDGEVADYSTEGGRIHAIATGDPLLDECFIFESETALVGLEMPARTADIEIWKKYVDSLGKPLAGIIVDAHPTGNTDIIGNVRMYTTKAAKEAMESGSTKAIINGLKDNIPGWDKNDPIVTDVIPTGDFELGGIKFEIIGEGDNFVVAVPAMKAVYTHMFGADTHSIMPGIEVIDAMIEEARTFIDAGYEIILSSHHAPELKEDVHAKIDYWLKVKEIIERSKNADEFRENMKNEFVGMKGEHYIDMSAAMIYPAK